MLLGSLVHYNKLLLLSGLIDLQGFENNYMYSDYVQPFTLQRHYHYFKEEVGYFYKVDETWLGDSSKWK